VVDRRRLVMVVVVDVQARMTAAPLGDEVDQLFERALLARSAKESSRAGAFEIVGPVRACSPTAQVPKLL